MTYCVLVHGTFSMRRWARDLNGPIRQAIKACVPAVQFEPFEWSGWHSQGARSRAAAELSARLGELCRQHEKVIVVGHSHGGNVALQAIQDLGCSPARSLSLVTLATPFLHARASNDQRNLRAVAAGAVALAFLAAIGAIFTRMNFWELFTIATVALAVGLFAVAVLTSHDWVPFLTRGMASRFAWRRQAYGRTALEQPVRMLVVYYPEQDGVTEVFNAVRRWSLRVAKQSRRAWSHADLESERWVAGSPNRSPAICIGAAGILVTVSLLADAGPYRVLLVGSILVLLLAGLIAFIWNYARPSFFGAIALTTLFLNGLGKVVYSITKSGFSLDFLFMFVRARTLPFNPNRYPVEALCLTADNTGHAWWRRVCDRLTFATHRKIVTKPEAVIGITDWLTAQDTSKRS